MNSTSVAVPSRRVSPWRKHEPALRSTSRSIDHRVWDDQVSTVLRAAWFDNSADFSQPYSHVVRRVRTYLDQRDRDSGRARPLKTNLATAHELVAHCVQTPNSPIEMQW